MLDLKAKTIKLMEKHGFTEADILKYERQDATKEKQLYGGPQGCTLRELEELFTGYPPDAYLSQQWTYDEWSIVWNAPETDDEYANRALKSLIAKKSHKVARQKDDKREGTVPKVEKEVRRRIRCTYTHTLIRMVTES